MRLNSRNEKNTIERRFIKTCIICKTFHLLFHNWDARRLSLKSRVFLAFIKYNGYCFGETIGELAKIVPHAIPRT